MTTFTPIKANAFDVIKNNISSSSLTLKSNSTKSRSLNPIIKAQQSSTLYQDSNISLNKEKELTGPKTLGKGWFNFEELPMTEDLKRDLKLLELRNYMDPKIFYKKSDKLGPIVHVGTVVEGPTEYKSSRLTNKQRKQNFAGEILGDNSIKHYSKRVFNEIQVTKNKKVKAYKSSKSKQKSKSRK